MVHEFVRRRLFRETARGLCGGRECKAAVRRVTRTQTRHCVRTRRVALDATMSTRAIATYITVKKLF